MLRLVSRGATVVLDQRAVLDGRGAYLHRQADCLTLAVRKRAFARALRIGGSVDVSEVERVWAEQYHYQSVATRSAG